MPVLNRKYVLGSASAGGGSSAKPKYVPELPEEGEEGALYLVPTELTRDGYQIYQEFTWYDDGWKAVGAFDVGISPDGILYEENFDSSTNTLDATTLGEDAKNSLSTIAGYNQNAPAQRLANVGGVMKWQTKEVWYDNFGQYADILPNLTWPATITSVDVLFQIQVSLASSAQGLFGTVNTSILYAGSNYQAPNKGRLGYWDGANDNWFTDVLESGTVGEKWIRLVGDTSSQTVYLIDDDNYTPETLPELSSWTQQGTTTESFGNSTIVIAPKGNNYFRGIFKNLIIKANGTKIFDLRDGDNVTYENSNTQAYKAALDVRATEHWK